jgi:hypothetical protein
MRVFPRGWPTIILIKKLEVAVEICAPPRHCCAIMRASREAGPGLGAPSGVVSSMNPEQPDLAAEGAHPIPRIGVDSKMPLADLKR